MTVRQCLIEFSQNLLLHLDLPHAETERAPLANPIRKEGDRPVASLNNLLHDGQAKADSLVVLICCTVQLTKAREQLRLVFLRDPSARVGNSHEKQAFLRLVADLHLDEALLREFERVLDQIDEHLLETALIA